MIENYDSFIQGKGKDEFSVDKLISLLFQSSQAFE